MGVGIILGMSPAWASFVGPISPYYLDDVGNETIYVVQGTSVINSFPWAYGVGAGCPAGSNCESSLAVTNVVSTDWWGNVYGSPGTAGQYTLSGTPTVTSWTDTPPPAGETFNATYDSTSDGTHNYTIEFYNNHYTENVVETNLNFQNPIVLFSPSPGAFQWIGIAYDPFNNSLWLSSNGGLSTIADYSLTGALLSSFTTVVGVTEDSLGFDPADGTLWFNSGAGNLLWQYSTSGTLLQDGTPSGLPSGPFYSGDFAEAAPSSVPEPASLTIFGSALIGLGAALRRKRKTA
jgi:hypothetical protein